VRTAEELRATVEAAELLRERLIAALDREQQALRAGGGGARAAP